MRTSDFDYNLPQESIAQNPIEPRDTSRLMVLDRRDGAIKHQHFHELLNFLHSGDVMVFNDSRVIPARLTGTKTGTGGAVEILLLRRLSPNVWETLVKPGRRVKTGAKMNLLRGEQATVTAEVLNEGEGGIRTIQFSDESLLCDVGIVALPPYIHEPMKNPGRYQTVYAKLDGSVAAPTAGLHFTPELLRRIDERGVKRLFVTLHIGLDTFRPVQEDNPNEHRIHKEYGYVSEEVAKEITRAKKEGRRIICVGTTSVRLVEAVAQLSGDNLIKPFEGWVDLFILPGYKFRMTGAMITNFHLPKSTLLMLVSAFAGKELIDKAYHTAIEEKYRFYSFGDAMLIL